MENNKKEITVLFFLLGLFFIDIKYIFLLTNIQKLYKNYNKYYFINLLMILQWIYFGSMRFLFILINYVAISVIIHFDKIASTYNSVKSSYGQVIEIMNVTDELNKIMPSVEYVGKRDKLNKLINKVESLKMRLSNYTNKLTYITSKCKYISYPFTFVISKVDYVFIKLNTIIAPSITYILHKIPFVNKYMQNNPLNYLEELEMVTQKENHPIKENELLNQIIQSPVLTTNNPLGIFPNNKEVPSMSEMLKMMNEMKTMTETMFSPDGLDKKKKKKNKYKS